MAHIHVMKHVTPNYIRHIAFREYLKNHKEVKRRYGAQKKQLTQRDWEDPVEYSMAKDSFIKLEEAKAISWFKKEKNHLLNSKDLTGEET